MSRCLCESPLEELKNTHYIGNHITLSLMGEGEDKGIVIFSCDSMVIATFDINYCPICGKKLHQEVISDERD